VLPFTPLGVQIHQIIKIIKKQPNLPNFPHDPLEDRDTEMASFCLLKLTHFNSEAWINPVRVFFFVKGQSRERRFLNVFMLLPLPPVLLAIRRFSGAVRLPAPPGGYDNLLLWYIRYHCKWQTSEVSFMNMGV
jgi:hypothetical protein